MTTSTVDTKAALRKAVSDVVDVFGKHNHELRDLRWSFWFALGALHGANAFGDVEAVLIVLRSRSRDLGAPGDFGYGSPCGDALRNLYGVASAFAA